MSDGSLRIAFVGLHGSGKTYAAHYLYKQHGFKTLRMQDGVAKVIKWFYKYRPHKRIKWERRIEFYDALYALDNDIHVDYLLRRLDGGQKTTRDVVIDDVRYANEIIKLREAGFIIIRMTMENEKLKRIVSNKHTSQNRINLNEQFNKFNDIYEVDYSILNVTSAGLQKMLDHIVEKEREKLAGQSV